MGRRRRRSAANSSRISGGRPLVSQPKTKTSFSCSAVPYRLVEPGAAQVLVAEIEAERLDQVQFGAGVGAHADDVARIGWDFRLIENDGEHDAGFLRSKVRIKSRNQSLSARATTATVTEAAPCSLSTRAHSLAVAPVVNTSSTSRICRPLRSARHSKAPRTFLRLSFGNNSAWGVVGLVRSRMLRSAGKKRQF